MHVDGVSAARLVIALSRAQDDDLVAVSNLASILEDLVRVDQPADPSGEIPRTDRYRYALSSEICRFDHEQKGKLIQNEKDIYAKEMMAYKFMGTEESTDDGCD